MVIQERKIKGHSDCYEESYPVVLAKKLYASGHMMPVDGTLVTGEVAAHINHGRWMVECPYAPCPSKQVVNLDVLVFYCGHCANWSNGGDFYAVALPDDREAIEAALLQRPIPEVMNWGPTETAASLLAENVVHGVG